MVQKLNIILITSQELIDFRKRLKNLDSKVSLVWPAVFIDFSEPPNVHFPLLSFRLPADE